MKLYSHPQVSEEDKCPYLPSRQARYDYFFASDLTEKEFQPLLDSGFRKFGLYFFRPNCANCNECRPLRVRVNDFKPSKSQRRIINKNKDTIMKVTNLNFREEIYDLYVKHSEAKFDTKEHPIASANEFIQSHFTKTTPSLLSEFYYQEKLIAVGFMDISENGVSSVYFIYDPDFSHLGLGTFGAIKEIELAQEMFKDYYYLGFYIAENRSMKYKSAFKPFELLDWHDMSWSKP